jgi:NifB/MoaA-like Fe-S oxidoreductase
LFLRVLGRRMVFAADEYYLMAELPFPDAEQYEGFHMHEDGIGMARTFELEFLGEAAAPTGVQSGFFAWVDGAPAAGYRAPRNPAGDTGLRGPAPAAEVGVQLTARRDAPIGILTGEYGARVITPLVHSLGRSDVRVLPVRNAFFGGNTSVTGLMVGEDIARVLADQPVGHRYLLPDVCLSEGRFLDGTTIESLPRPVEVVPTDGIALRRALGAPILESVS